MRIVYLSENKKLMVGNLKFGLVSASSGFVSLSCGSSSKQSNRSSISPDIFDVIIGNCCYKYVVYLMLQVK